MLFKRGALAGLASLVLGGFWASEAGATEKHFSYSYESAGMPKGTRELEIWSTNRIGRRQRYIRFDERVELEIGLTDSLLTALYVNTSASIAGAGDATEKDFAFEGLSSEWLLKLSSSSADVLGSALYAEVSYGPGELELEAKLILDKVVGPMLLVSNLVYELEVEDLGGENGVEHLPELDLGLAYMFNPSVALGIEARDVNVIEHGELEHSTIFVGPMVSWGGDPAWMTLTVLGQVGSIRGEEEEGAGEGESKRFGLNLDSYERLSVRLLLGVPL